MPPQIDEQTIPNAYRSYFENQYGEQAIFLYEYWRERGIERHPYPHSFDLSHPEIDFVGLARALGADAMRVDKPDQVPEAVERILSAQRPFLVDLLTDDLIRP